MSTFRPEYKQLTRIVTIKDKAQELLDFILDDNGTTQAGSRELSLAKKKLEEAVMWAVKHWTA